MRDLFVQIRIKQYQKRKAISLMTLSRDLWHEKCLVSTSIGWKWIFKQSMLADIWITSPATIILLITSGTHFGLILWKYTNINLRVINSSNSSIAGTGTLGVPFAVMQGGYMSLVAIVVISLITNYTGKLIIECLYEKPFNDQGTRGVRLRNSYALIGNTDFAVKNNL